MCLKRSDLIRSQQVAKVISLVIFVELMVYYINGIRFNGIRSRLLHKIIRLEL